MVTDNLCFVIDGDSVKLADLVEDHQFWKPTSKPVRYYYSDDLKTFRRVHIVLAKGKLIRARCNLRKPGGKLDQREVCKIIVYEEVPLEQVFRVSRHFSHWESCSKFHKIVSAISPIEQSASVELGFKRRIFVQYIWRAAKESEKLRVALESKNQMRRASSTLSLPAVGKSERRKTIHSLAMENAAVTGSYETRRRSKFQNMNFYSRQNSPRSSIAHL